MVTNNISRPALRWFGGKWKLADWIISHFPAHTCYCEPYSGAASVLIRKSPAFVEVYNDLNGMAVNFFKVLRERPDALVRAIASTGRSAGVHLIACTQNPIDRLVKDLPAQFNRRLVGRVQTNIQSKTATGFAGLGAEYLIGDGDFLSVKGGEVRRFQGAILPQHGKREAISQRVITMQEPNKVAPALPAPSAQVSQSVPSIFLPAVDESASMRLQKANEFRRDLEINFLKFIFTHAPDIQTDAARARIMWPHLQKLEGGWQRRYDELKKEVIAQLQAK